MIQLFHTTRVLWLYNRFRNTKNIIGLMTDGIATCCGIVMMCKYMDKKMYFLAHIDEITDIEDKDSGLINWIKICQNSLYITDVEKVNIEIILHYGKDTGTIGSGCDYSERISKIVKDNGLNISLIQHKQSSDNCLLFRNSIESYNLANTIKKVGKIQSSQLPFLKKSKEDLALDTTNQIFFVPTGFVLSLKDDGITVINSQQEKIQLFRMKFETSNKKYPLLEYYSGTDLTNGSNMIESIYKQQTTANFNILFK